MEEKRMFDNIGGKIKAVAKFNCWFGIFASIISGLFFAGTMKDLAIIGFLIIAFGSLLSWVGSFLMYGIGEMVENSDIRTELAVKESMERKENNKIEEKE